VGAGALRPAREDEIRAVGAEPGYASPVAGCGAPMRAERGVEVGNIFKLGTRYAEAFGAYSLDGDGRRRPIVMGSYGIGVGRLLACIAE
jgi:prolyl-tRNA synthetase